MSNSPVSRCEHVDIAKAIGMILVIFGHLITFGSRASDVIYSFHMPLFYFLSGVFADIKRTNFREYIKHKAKTLLLPYVVLCSVCGLITFIVPQYRKDFVWKDFFYNMLCSNPTDIKSGALWFLPSLFFVTVFFYFFYHLIYKKYHILFSAIGLLAIVALSQLYCMPYFKIGTALMGFVIYFIGFYLKDYVKMTKITGYEKFLFVPCLLSVLVFSQINSTVGFVNGSYGNIGIFFFTSTCGIILVLTTSKFIVYLSEKISLFNKFKTWLVFFGKNTLITLGTHGILFTRPYAFVLSSILGYTVVSQRTIPLPYAIIGGIIIVPLQSILLYVIQKVKLLLHK